MEQIVVKIDNITLSMDEDGLEGTIEDEDLAPLSVRAILEPEDVVRIKEWCEKVLRATEELHFTPGLKEKLEADPEVSMQEDGMHIMYVDRNTGEILMLLPKREWQKVGPHKRIK